MKSAFALAALILVLATLASAGSSVTDKRDKAMKEIQACLRRNHVPSRECKNFNQNVDTLVDVYWQGDKTVLPTLLRFTYLSSFYSSALIADPDTFLTAVSQLPEANQRTVAQSIAEPRPQGVTLARFEAIRSTLQAVPQSSPSYQLAQMFMDRLEAENVSLLTNYFPPNIFSGGAAEFMVHWFSRDLHLLREEPLWPPASPSQTVYRITLLPTFSAPESVTLTAQQDGTGQIAFHSLESQDPQWRWAPSSWETTRTITARQLAGFAATLDRAQFWQSPTELQRPGAIGLDGAQYIFEGVRDGAYHIVVRWCPGATHQKPFADAARELFVLSGQRFKSGC